MHTKRTVTPHNNNNHQVTHHPHTHKTHKKNPNKNKIFYTVRPLALFCYSSAICDGDDDDDDGNV